MADTVSFRCQNEDSLALVHLRGKVQSYDFLVYDGRKADLLAEGVAFYSPQEWEFAGKTYRTALYIPVEWLEPKTS